MNDNISTSLPPHLVELEAKCATVGFTMPSDRYIGSLLRTLISSKPKANILELGTGIGLSLCWMIDGMDASSSLVSIDNDEQLTAIAQQYFGDDDRVEIVCIDGGEWIKNYQGDGFDLIFADAWPGKYYELEETLDLLKVGGFYVIDDMTKEPNWPEGHEEKANRLLDYLAKREDLHLTKMNWSTGVLMAAKKY